jgi:glycosyltransferase involved in cell wall biosynthesis
MTGAPPVERVTLVLGTSAGGMGTHVKMLAAGLSERGIAVSVIGPSAADTQFSFSALSHVAFAPVEIATRPGAADLAGLARLRRLLTRPTSSAPRPDAPADRPADDPPSASRGTGSASDAKPDSNASGAGRVVHAHGLRAGALTLLSLGGVRAGRPEVVVTVHNDPPVGGHRAVLVYRLLERVVARRADLVLCVSPDLERRMRAAGACRVARAVIAAPDPAPGGRAGPPPAIAPTGRPLVLAVGRLTAQKDFGVLLAAAATWQDLDPPPLLVIAGDGPLAGQLRAQAAALGVAAVFPGHRDDIPALLAAAAVFVLPSRWEGQPLVLQEALRAGTPVVATRVGGIPGLAGEDAALLVPPQDPRALAAAVRSALTDAPLAARLRAAASKRAATLPSQDDAVAAALDAYVPGRRGARPR